MTQENVALETFTRSRCPELASFLADCCEAPLSFAGDYPSEHSAHNHIHLWALEYWADRRTWITLDYRVAFVQTLLDRWRARLKGYAPYNADGYRMYLYEDLAPTVSVVAETQYGFPYGGEANFVPGVRDIMQLYAGRSWQKCFAAVPAQLSDTAILAAIDEAAGSIGKPAADALGLKVGKLRILIEQMDLREKVNALRKRHKRRPAVFRSEEALPFAYAVFEERLPPRYR